MAEQKPNKQREIITINCGGCGVNLGQNILQQFAAEHGISSSGDKECKTKYDSTIPILFTETSKGKYISRSLFTDSNPYSINNIKKRYSHNSLLHPEYLINSNSDACSNFATGHYSKGRELIDSVSNQLRTLVEASDNIQGFLFNRSLSGGTGGGLGTVILQRIASDYRSKMVFGMSVFPDDNRATSAMEIYNTLLSMHWLLDRTDVNIIFDNKACSKICKHQLKTNANNFSNYNSLITKLISDITATSRFAINEIFRSIHMDMVPFPRLHFLTSSMWPLLPIANKNVIFKDDIQSLTDQCLDPKNFMCDAMDFDVQEDKNMAVSFCYRGNDISKYMSQCNITMEFLRNNRKLTFTEWTSAKPMIKFIDNKSNKLRNDNMLITDKQVSMVMNNSWISRLFSERIVKTYDVLYSQKLYVHHYVSEGMEEGEFAVAKEDLGFLQKDYRDVLGEQYTDDEDDDY